eukprot:SAG31_NODE_882_length_11260_cov_3.357104_6_plen_87_part_00
MWPFRACSTEDEPSLESPNVVMVEVRDTDFSSIPNPVDSSVATHNDHDLNESLEIAQLRQTIVIERQNYRTELNKVTCGAQCMNLV